eukprot:2475774-Heterocapsa_arctica.AAC.1
MAARRRRRHRCCCSSCCRRCCGCGRRSSCRPLLLDRQDEASNKTARSPNHANLAPLSRRKWSFSEPQVQERVVLDGRDVRHQPRQRGFRSPEPCKEGHA